MRRSCCIPFAFRGQQGRGWNRTLRQLLDLRRQFEAWGEPAVFQPGDGGLFDPYCSRKIRLRQLGLLEVGCQLAHTQNIREPYIRVKDKIDGWRI